MGHPVDEALDTARWADAAGWYGVWYADHYMPNTGTAEIQPGPTHECWAMLPAMATATEHVRIGSLVAPTSIHHPAVLANRATTIDHLSNGRMVLGLEPVGRSTSTSPTESSSSHRAGAVQRFEEAIQIVRALTTQDRTTFDGEVYTIKDATADPKPIRVAPAVARRHGRSVDATNRRPSCRRVEHLGAHRNGHLEASCVRCRLRLGGPRSTGRCTHRSRR